MAFNPMDFFQMGGELGKKKKSAVGMTAGYMSDLSAQRDKEKSKMNPLELIIAKQAIQPDTGVYSWNPLSGKLEQQASVPKGSIVRNTLGEDDLRTKAMIQQEAQATGKIIDAGGKLGTAVKRLKVINDQMNSALPTGNNSPMAQRIMGPAAVFGAKTGIAPNPKLMALKKNIRPVGIQLIRAFGEVGNLSETEQKSAIDTVENENLTEDERMHALKQFAEFALSGARPEAIEFMSKDPSVMEIVKDFGINIGSQNQTQQTEDPKERLRKKLIQKGLL